MPREPSLFVNTVTRRTALKQAGVLAGSVSLASLLPHQSHAQTNVTSGEQRSSLDDAFVKSLAMRALDATRSAGATYAEVRLTHTLERRISSVGSLDEELLHASVRSLVNGYWGFSSSPVWTSDEIARIGREATGLARANTTGKPREIDLSPAPVIRDGHWTMPIQIDPFTLHPLEIQDYLSGLIQQINHEAKQGGRVPLNRVDATAQFAVQSRAFGNTSGSYLTQRCYRTQGNVSLSIGRNTRFLPELDPASIGWELFRDQPVLDLALRMAEELRADILLPVKPIDVGRYTLALNASTVGRLISSTIGAATELDRALGYEANAGGTSYLTDPFTMLDTFAVGSPMLTVTANRSDPRGIATVRWDDEGVAPVPFTVIDQGVIRGFHTTRESAGWLNAALPARQPDAISNGSAAAPTAGHVPLSHTANLVMQPGQATLSMDDLVADMTRGYAGYEMQNVTDFQRSSGFIAGGRVYEVRDGRRVARVQGMQTLFRTTELWKSMLAIGGESSARQSGLNVTKGEPLQVGFHSVTAVPTVFKDQNLIEAGIR